jgi:hypothetical protein
VTDQQDVAPAGWETSPAPPAWALEQLAGVGEWRNLGERRWAGVVANVFNPDVLVLVNAAGTGFMKYAMALDGEPAFVVDQLWEDMQARLDHEALPECAKPDCADKAPTTFTAAEPGPLAGRQREPGERIHFCPRHGHDVYVAASGGPLAEWLRPDAVRLDPLDAMWAAAYAGDNHAYDEAVARLRKLTALTREPDA